MLPRVSQALTHYIAPIRSNTEKTNTLLYKPLEKEHQKKDSNHSQSNQEEPQQGEPAEVIDIKKAKEFSNSNQYKPYQILSLPPDDPDTSLTQSLLRMMNIFNEQRELLFRWLGKRVYQKTFQAQRKGQYNRQGSILDEKVS